MKNTESGRMENASGGLVKMASDSPDACYIFCILNIIRDLYLYLPIGFH